MVVAGKQVVRMQDVAKSVGVSLSTVSRVLRGEMDENSLVHKQILEIVDKMGYKRIRQNTAAAQAFKTKVKRTLNGNIAILAVESLYQWAYQDKGGFHCGVINSIQRFAENLGFHVILSVMPDDDTSIPAVVQKERVDGVIWFSYYDPNVILSINERVPLVLVNTFMPWPVITSVIPDSEQMFLLAVDHLKKLGHHRIGYFDGKSFGDHLISVLPEEQQSGFKFAINHFGLDDDPALIYRPLFRKHEIVEAMAGVMDYFLALKPRPTALVGGLSYFTDYLLAECRKRGIRVPDDLSVIAFDEADIARVVNPPLTTLSSRYEECGRIAADLLFQKIADPDRLPVTVRTAPELIIRKSTAEALKT